MKEKLPKAVVLLSGGLDSAVAAAVMQQECSVLGLFVDYGQESAKKEAQAARSIANYLAFPLKTMKIEGYPMGEGIIVPNRNMVLLSLGIALAQQKKFPIVTFSGHAGDHEVFPDCRMSFIDTMDKAAKYAVDPDDWGIVIATPLMKKTKSEIVELAETHGVPREMTWSCYGPGPAPCNECLSCVELNKA